MPIAAPFNKRKKSTLIEYFISRKKHDLINRMHWDSSFDEGSSRDAEKNIFINNPAVTKQLVFNNNYAIE